MGHCLRRAQEILGRGGRSGGREAIGVFLPTREDASEMLYANENEGHL